MHRSVTDAGPTWRRWTACGIREVQVDGSQAHVVLPAGLAHFRRRLDAPLMEALLAIQAATAREDGLVSPAHLVGDTCPSAPGSPRVNDAVTLYKAPKKSSRSSPPSPRSTPPASSHSWGRSSNSSTPSSG